MEFTGTNDRRGSSPGRRNVDRETTCPYHGESDLMHETHEKQIAQNESGVKDLEKRKLSIKMFVVYCTLFLGLTGAAYTVLILYVGGRSDTAVDMIEGHINSSNAYLKAMHSMLNEVRSDQRVTLYRLDRLDKEIEKLEKYRRYSERNTKKNNP